MNIMPAGCKYFYSRRGHDGLDALMLYHNIDPDFPEYVDYVGPSMHMEVRGEYWFVPLPFNSMETLQ